MSRRIVHFLVFYMQMGTLSFSSGSRVTENGGAATEYHRGAKRQLLISSEISTRQMDVTTPITTVPTIITQPNTTTTPILNPAVSNPDSPPAATTTSPLSPVITPASSTTTAAANPISSGRSWCVASQSASPTALQVALDYACGYGGADCSAVQPGGSCYNPDSIRQHASYAFNTYYQKNPVPTSCNFGGTAVATNTDPSHGTCQYPSTSTSSSILNTTNSSGATVFGAGPITPTGSSAAVPGGFPCVSIIVCLLMLLVRDQRRNMNIF